MMTDKALATPATSIRQHTSAYVSIRQHTSAYVSIRQHTSAMTDTALATPGTGAVGLSIGTFAPVKQVNWRQYWYFCTSKASKLSTWRRGVVGGHSNEDVSSACVCGGGVSREHAQP